MNGFLFTQCQKMCKNKTFCIVLILKSQATSQQVKNYNISSKRLSSCTLSIYLAPKISFTCLPLSKSKMLRFAKLTEHAFAPVRGSEKAAGVDLKSAYDCKVPAKGKALVKTDLQVAVPSGCYGRVAPRSGLALKNHIDVGAGVVDEDYRGNLGVVLFNFSDADFEVKKGDRVAQLICEKILIPELEELKSLDETERGVNGFGSTGVH